MTPLNEQNTVYAVEVPKFCYSFCKNQTGLIRYYTDFGCFDIPDSSGFKFLGTISADSCDFDCSDLVERNKKGGITYYLDYIPNKKPKTYLGFAYPTASFLSLLKSKGLDISKRWLIIKK